MTATGEPTAAPVVLEREGGVVVVTFNRPERRDVLDAAANEVREVLR